MRLLVGDNDAGKSRLISNANSYAVVAGFFHGVAFHHVAENDTILDHISHATIADTCSDDVQYIIDVINDFSYAVGGFVQLAIIFVIFGFNNLFIALLALVIDLIYIILTNHIICPNMMFMNGDVWNSLSDHDKEVVSTAIANAIEWQGQQQLEAEAKLADELTEKGCTVITPDDTIKEATVPFIQPAIEDWDLLQTYAD